MRSAKLPPMRHALALVLLVLVACLSLVVAGCATTTSATNSTPTSQKPLISTDAHGTPITIPATAPQRIVSLTPGDSEMLAAVGVSARVVGVVPQ